MHLHNKYKKRILAAMFLLLGIHTVHAQTTTQNYIRMRVPNRAMTTNTKLDANTNKIVSQYGTTQTIGYAALTCYNLDKNGYSDWYLPSIDELSQLKKNLYDNPLGLAPGHFWSSATTVAGYAWCLGTDAVTDAPDQFLISAYATVCSVRSF